MALNLAEVDALAAEVRGKRLSREEEDEILGFGPGGV
jgi:hypothetical protein